MSHKWHRFCLNVIEGNADCCRKDGTVCVHMFPLKG